MIAAQTTFWTRPLSALEMLGLSVALVCTMLWLFARKSGFRPRALGVASFGAVIGIVLFPAYLWSQPLPTNLEAWLRLAAASLSVGLILGAVISVVGVSGHDKVFGAAWLARFLKAWCWKPTVRAASRQENG